MGLLLLLFSITNIFRVYLPSLSQNAIHCLHAGSCGRWPFNSEAQTRSTLRARYTMPASAMVSSYSRIATGQVAGQKYIQTFLFFMMDIIK